MVDLLISNCTINHAEDKQSVWNEIFRILKPGGRFVVSDIYSIGQVPEEYASDPWRDTSPRDRVSKSNFARSYLKETYLTNVQVAI